MSFLKSEKFLVTVGVLVFIIISGFKFLDDKFVVGLKHPESAYFNGDYIFISNIGSSAMSKNLDGFITKLDRYGNILEYEFLDKLQAPKGLWLHKNMLYIADLNRVCAANIETKRMSCKNIKGSKFLNDIIYVNDRVYVTDTLTDNVYEINGSKISVFYHKKGLSPNGIVFSKKLNALIVVSFNKPVVNILSLDGKLEKSIYLKKFSGFDGIFIARNSVYLSDYRLKEVLKTKLNFKRIKVIKRFNTPVADIFIYKKMLIAPLLEANKLYLGKIGK